MMDELKPCPFCGCSGVVNYDKRGSLEQYIVESGNSTCPASIMLGWSYRTEEEAIKAWNRRVELKEKN